METNFDKQFPSLKGHLCNRPNVNKYCLDKEIVKKAIEKCITTLYEFSDGGEINGIKKEDIWKELKL